MAANADPRLVFVHDWLTGMRGGEKCLEVLCRRWHVAPLVTLLHRRGSVSAAIEHHPLRTSPLQRFPQVHRYYRFLLPLMPLAAASWRVPRCDLLVSFSHCVAKSAQPPPGVPHLCYCFTPMRYAWHMRESYFGRTTSLKGRLLDHCLDWLREWDRQTADRVTQFIAISETVRTRIAECYGRESEVIYPPVDTDFYCPAPARRDDFYLVVSAFAPYKRVELAIKACNDLRRPLHIIGTGQHEAQLRSIAGPTIQFLGWQSDEVIRDQLRRCRALLFPGEEDFGIVPVEANACGAAVIAFGRGGATETIVPQGSQRPATGVWFEEQSAACLVEAMHSFERESDQFDPAAARRQAVRFQTRRFEDRMLATVERTLNGEPQPLRIAA